MENKKLIKRCAYLVGIAVLAGFLILVFMPTTYINPFGTYLLLGEAIFSFIGVLEGVVIGWLAYLIFKWVKNKIIYWVIFLFFLLVGFCIGASTLGFILRLSSRTQPYENTIDTNRDGKIDKWIYENDMSSRVEIDTDFDGKPDKREYYENAKLIKKERIINSLQK